MSGLLMKKKEFSSRDEGEDVGFGLMDQGEKTEVKVKNKGRRID